jgi:hypothetical protein
VLVFEGSGGRGGSILAPPTLGPGSVNDTLTFDGTGGSGSSIAGDRPAPLAGTARAKYPKKVKFCVRRHKHAKAKCTTLTAAPVPFIAATRTTITTAGPHTLTLPVSRAGQAILTATREADRLYRKHHPHGHHPPAGAQDRRQLQTKLTRSQGQRRACDTRTEEQAVKRKPDERWLARRLTVELTIAVLAVKS